MVPDHRTTKDDPREGLHEVTPTADDVAAARSMLRDPAKVARGAWARDAGGNPLDDPLDPRAVSHCAIGAIGVAVAARVKNGAANIGHIFSVLAGVETGDESAYAALLRGGQFSRISHTNDAGTHAELMDELERVEAKLRAWEER